MASPAATRKQLTLLYNSYVRTATSFSSYNFREYFLRRTEQKFKNELPALIDPAFSSPVAGTGASSSSTPLAPPAGSTPSTSENTLTGPGAIAEALSPDREARLTAWVKEAEDELIRLKRCVVVNRLYQAPKLVVEGKGRAMTLGGGGAGMEQSAGGGGQPVNPDDPGATKATP